MTKLISTRAEAELEVTAQAIVDASDDPHPFTVGSTVCLPDMTANLNAKVTVSREQQADPRLLAVVYDDMAQKFYKSGLNLGAVEAMQQYFTNLDTVGPAIPLHYAKFPVPLPPAAVRLAVIFFQEENQRLAELLHQASIEIMAALPKDFKTHLNSPSHYHITVYMTSQPHTLRPNPLDIETGGLPPGSPSAEEIAVAAQPADEVLHKEITIMKNVSAATPAPKFRVHRLVMADSGTLLLCSVDETGHLAELRLKMKEAFPGGPPKQSTIVHASLARLLTPRQLTVEEVQRVQRACDIWTERVKGLLFHPKCLYHIREQTFTTVEGPRIRLPLGDDGS